MTKRPELSERLARALADLSCDVYQNNLDNLAMIELQRLGLVRRRKAWFGGLFGNDRLEITTTGCAELAKHEPPKPPPEWPCGRCNHGNPAIAEWCCRCGLHTSGAIGEFGAVVR